MFSVHPTMHGRDLVTLDCDNGTKYFGGHIYTLPARGP